MKYLLLNILVFISCTSFSQNKKNVKTPIFMINGFEYNCFNGNMYKPSIDLFSVLDNSLIKTIDVLKEGEVECLCNNLNGVVEITTKYVERAIEDFPILFFDKIQNPNANLWIGHTV